MMPRWRVSLLVALALAPVGAPRAGAQDLAMAKPRFVATWVAPGEPNDASGLSLLQRRVSLDLTDVPLAVALRQVARKARLDLSYDKSVLPPGKRVSLHAQELTVVSALTEILLQSRLDVAVGRGGQLGLVPKPEAAAVDSGSIAGRVTDRATGAPIVGATIVLDGLPQRGTSSEDGGFRLAEVPVGTYTIRVRYIGYAPGTASVTVSADQEATADFALQKSAQKLDEVVTTGTMVPTEVKALPTPISVITSDQIRQKNIQRVDQLLRGDVPGVLAWDNGSASYHNTIVVRGATSLLGGNYIKTYVDGVEVTDPTYISGLDPMSIDRIEIVRGPEASTIYGSDALNGVMQIFTKKGALATGPTINLKTTLGMRETQYRPGQSQVFAQDHSGSVSGGGTEFSYHLGGSYRYDGGWLPEYLSKTTGASGGIQGSQGPLTLSVSSRYSLIDVHLPQLPVFQGAYPDIFPTPVNQENKYRAIGVGGRAQYRALPWWSHELTIGYDAMDASGGTTTPTLHTPEDTARTINLNPNNRTSVTYRTTVSIRPGERLGGTVTAGADYYSFNGSQTVLSSPTGLPTLPGTTFQFGNLLRFQDVGLYAQAQLAVEDALFLTGGIRTETNDNFGAGYGRAWAPRVGASYVITRRSATLKLRGSYGEAIRPPSPFQVAADPASNTIVNPTLGPEAQQGFDLGADLLAGSRLSLSATYYNQTAIDLIDLVLVDATTEPPTQQYQNIGRVKNTGLELQATVTPFDQVTLTATYALMNSRVRQLSPSYTGDMRPGDRVLGVPKHSGGATISYRGGRSGVSLSATYAGALTNIDYFALYGFYFGGQPYRGSGRAYWTSYPAFVKLGLNGSYDVTRNVTALVHVDNLTNNYAFEQYNFSPPPGRLILAGVQVH
jgi:outer membrane receptor protein involved in Fe transport